MQKHLFAVLTQTKCCKEQNICKGNLCILELVKMQLITMIFVQLFLECKKREKNPPKMNIKRCIAMMQL